MLKQIKKSHRIIKTKLGDKKFIKVIE